MFEFSYARFGEITAGDTFAPAVVTASPTGLNIGGNSTMGGVVMVQISGGQAGVQHIVQCAARSAGGSTLVESGSLYVLPQ
jgi:hypothetical protein